MGVEILISGKIPGARAKTWRFYQGYLKKCGDIALTGVQEANVYAQLKSGTVGVKVRIMGPDVQLPDKIKVRETVAMTIEEAKTEEKVEQPKPEQPKKRQRKKPEAKKEHEAKKETPQKKETETETEVKE